MMEEEKKESVKQEEDTFETDKKPFNPIAHRMFHPPKLERKHSSGDLHSRLKTRKILGVGETDNGDIHRSKISQLLGHNEHLYVKFPRGYWCWHLAMAVTYSVLGLNNLFFPEKGWAVGRSDDPAVTSQLPSRYYGCASLTLALLLWLFWGTSDKAVVKSLLTAIAVYHLLQAIAGLLDQGQDRWTLYFCMTLALLLLSVMPCVYFYRLIGHCGLRMRKSNSFGNLKECTSASNCSWKKMT